MKLSGWVNNQVEPTSVQPTKTLLEESVASGDIILTFKHCKKPLFFHKLYRHCTGFSEYVLRRYDSKQMALGEPKHVLWQSLESIKKKIKKEDIYVLLFDESLNQQLKKNSWTSKLY